MKYLRMSLAVGLLFAATTACNAQNEQSNEQSDDGFVGSEACAQCHQAIFDRWQDTLMANILVDVDERPEVILGDFSTPNELVTFDQDDIDFTYGSKWKQRYFTRIGDDFFAFPAQWDVMNEMWRRYYPQPGTEWWTGGTTHSST